MKKKLTAEEMLKNPITQKVLKTGFGDDKDKFVEMNHAKTKNYKPNIYYHVQTGGSQAGVGYGLYLGRDKQALINFYDVEGEGKPVDIYLGENIKWLDLMDYDDYKNFKAKAMKKYGKKEWLHDNKMFDDVGDTMRKLAVKMGYDGIRYYDPYATGEEFVLFNVTDDIIQKLAMGGIIYGEKKYWSVGGFVKCPLCR